MHIPAKLFLIGLTILLLAPVLRAQEASVITATPPIKTLYTSNGGEWIFSTPILDVDGSDRGAVIRFSPFFNAQWYGNYDLNEHVGLFLGLSIRNQGFIYQVPDTSIRYKFRTYNVWLPVGFKLGNMNKTLVYFGYELEMPFNYKEKLFENEKKEDKFNVWFSDRTEPFFQSVFVGFQGPYGATLTVRYYLTNFHNKDFTETVDGVEVKPYAGLNSNVLAISIGYALFDGRRSVFNWEDDARTKDVNAWRD